MRHRARHPRGFTLLELVLVMVLLATFMAMIAAEFRGFRSSSESRDAVTHLLAMTQWARSKATSDATVYRLNIDAASNSYWGQVRAGQQFVAPGTEFGQRWTVPQGYRLDLLRGDGDAAPWIDFHPTGRAEPATITITDTLGNATFIQSPSPTEPFRVLTPEEVARR